MNSADQTIDELKEIIISKGVKGKDITRILNAIALIAFYRDNYTLKVEAIREEPLLRSFLVMHY
jgi:hypothetical protein